MSGIVLLDGGMGQELLRRAAGERSPLWSAKVVRDEPDLVRDLHADFIRAGARVIIVSSYSVTRPKLAEYGDVGEFRDLQERACRLAIEARDMVGEDVAIAGSLPPLTWSYRPEAVGAFDEIEPQYREIAEVEAPFVDLLICETMTTPEEGRAAVSGAQVAGKPVWIGWTLAEGGQARLRTDQELAEGVTALDGLEVDALLINCSTPEDTNAAMPELKRLADERGIPFGAYANGFNPIPAEFTPGTVSSVIGHRHDLGPDEYADAAMAWVDHGVTIVGGCCEIGPGHIARLAERLGAAGHTPTKAAA